MCAISTLSSCIWANMKQSNNNKSNRQRKRSLKNKDRIADKPHLSKHEKWEIKERLKILSDAYSKFE